MTGVIRAHAACSFSKLLEQLEAAHNHAIEDLREEIHRLKAANRSTTHTTHHGDHMKSHKTDGTGSHTATSAWSDGHGHGDPHGSHVLAAKSHKSVKGEMVHSYLSELLHHKDAGPLVDVHSSGETHKHHKVHNADHHVAFQDPGKSSQTSMASQHMDAVVSSAESNASAEPTAAKAKNSKIGRGLSHIRHRMSVNHSFDNTPAYKLPVAILKRIVQDKFFEATFCGLIFLNALIMAIEVQYDGMDIGFDIGYPKSDGSAEESWPGAATALSIISWSFGIIFTVEIVAKLFAFNTQFFRDHWNWIDLIMVILWVISKLEGSLLPINSQLFRLARLGRLLRFLRLVRKIQGFDSLFVMTTAIKGSVSVLLWTFVLLSMVQMMIALFVNQYLHEFYFKDSAKPESELQVVYTYFGTFTRAFFSMFEITLANWPPAIRILAQNVSEWFMLFGLMHKLSVGFAVVAVINGVFMQETFKVASMDDVLMVRQKERAQNRHRAKMQRLMAEADREHADGSISREEWRTLVSDPQIKLWLASMELDAGDADHLFTLMDQTTDGEITLDELVGGVNRLKGAARSLDLITLMRDQQLILDSIRMLQRASVVSEESPPKQGDLA